jgi:hypothetical protein
VTIAAAPLHSASLHTARHLARDLLSGACDVGDAEIVAAFASYREMLNAGDLRADKASQELATWYQSPRGEPYFLELLQAQIDKAERKRSGAFYTPWPIAQYIVRRIERLVPNGPLRIVDPACGGGVFLLAAADLAAQRPGSTLIGYDISAAGVAVTTELLLSAEVSATVRQINPLLSGHGLQPELLSGDGTLVILGNPPYSNFGRRNRSEWIDTLVADYRAGVAEQKFNLTDDFIKFLRWGQHWIDQAGRGVLAMITSRTYLSGLTHRGMRRSLAQSLPLIELVDLHGDGERDDENIFGIRRGVVIGVFGKRIGNESTGIRYHSVAGSRAKKLKWLVQEPPVGSPFVARPPEWLFVPAQRRTRQTVGGYTSWPRLDEIFCEFISGVQTKNDRLFVDFDRAVLAKRMKQHLAQLGESYDEGCLRPYVVAPFDRRWIYYEPRLLGRARWSVMRHMVQVEPNIALIFMRQSTSSSTYDHALVVDSLASDRIFYSRRGAPFLAPLWRSSASERLGNLNDRWKDGVTGCLGFQPDETTLLGYIYAILHAPSYRRDHLIQLQRGFPRIPWPRSSESFAQMAELGTGLIDCHLTNRSGGMLGMAAAAEQLMIAPGYPRFCDGTVQLNPRIHMPVSPLVAGFQVGGYPVMERWLKMRRGRALAAADVQQVGALCDIAETTQNIACQIDALMNQQ